MTTTPDQYEVWTEAAYDFIRDSLRADATVGITGSERVVSIEKGQPDLDMLARHPDNMPCIWVAVPSNRVTRDGGYLQHVPRIEVHTFSSASRGSPGVWADAQERHRQFTGRVYNQLLTLRDPGKALGHWLRFDPDGEVLNEGATVDDRAVLHSVIPFTFQRDRAWIQGS